MNIDKIKAGIGAVIGFIILIVKGSNSSVITDVKLDENKKKLDAIKDNAAKAEEDKKKNISDIEDKKAKDILIDKFGIEISEKIIDFRKKTLITKNWWDIRDDYFMIKSKFWEEDSLWIGMSKEVLSECFCPAEKVDQTVTKNIVREYFYYGEYTTIQKNKRYRFRIVLENDIVVGWKNMGGPNFHQAIFNPSALTPAEFLAKIKQKGVSKDFRK